MSDETMVERVAAALYEVGARQGPQFRGTEVIPWDKQDLPYVKERFHQLARAAIKAMREPTPKMSEAASVAPVYDGDTLAAATYRGMIDAALKEARNERGG